MKIIMNKFYLITLLNIFAVILAGCMVGPDFEKPEMSLPDKYRFSEEQTGEIVNLKWWELFDDPVLYSLVNSALEENKDVRIAISRIEEARAALGFTRADMFPFIDIDAAATKGTFAGGRRTDTTDSTAFITPVLSWELDFWGKLRRATESSRADLLASAYALRSTQISLITEVVSTYYLLLDFKERLEISQRTLKSRTDSLYIIKRRYEEGIIPELDVNQAEIQKENAATAIPVYKRLIAQTEDALSVLLGRFPSEIETGAPLYSIKHTPDIPVGLPSSLLERRPDIIAAEYNFKSETELIGVAVALRLPSINLTGSLGAASSELSNITSEGFIWSVGAGLFGPILNFNKDISRVKLQEARTRQALYEYELTVLNAFREVSNSLSDIKNYKEQVESVKRKYKAAENAERLGKMRYDRGVSSYLEVLETERALFDVEQELSQTTQEYYNSYVSLYKALGGGWISKQEELDSMDHKTGESGTDDTE